MSNAIHKYNFFRLLFKIVTYLLVRFFVNKLLILLFLKMI